MSIYLSIFATALVRRGLPGPERLKGNQVKGLNRPATVSSISTSGYYPNVTGHHAAGKTVREGNKSGDLPCGLVSIISWTGLRDGHIENSKLPHTGSAPPSPHRTGTRQPHRFNKAGAPASYPYNIFSQYEI